MTQDDQKAFDDLFDTFNSAGWKLIVDEGKLEYDQLLRVLASEKDPAVFHEIQGKLVVLDRMIHFKELTEATYDNILAEEELQKETEDADV